MRLLRWSFLVLGVLIAIVVATLPLRWVLPAQSLPIAVLEAQGSIWNGSLRGVTWKAQPIGDVQVALQPWPLVRGEQHVRLATSTVELIALQGARHGIDQGNGRVLLRQPGGITLLDLAVDLRQVQAVFDATRCVQAAGEVTVQIVPTSAGEAVGLLPLRLRGDHVAMTLRWNLHCSPMEGCPTACSSTPSCACSAMAAGNGAPRSTPAATPPCTSVCNCWGLCQRRSAACFVLIRARCNGAPST